MIKSKSTSINSFWSIFNEPICLNGIEIKPVECDENAMWDLTHIFDGTPDWMPMKRL